MLWKSTLAAVLLMQSKCELNSDCGWTSGEIQTVLAQKYKGHSEVASFSSNSTLEKKTIMNIVAESPKEILGDSNRLCCQCGWECASLSLFESLLLLSFSLFFTFAFRSQCSYLLGWFKPLLSLAKYNYLTTNKEKITQHIHWWILNHRKEIACFQWYRCLYLSLVPILNACRTEWWRGWRCLKGHHTLLNLDPHELIDQRVIVSWT